MIATVLSSKVSLARTRRWRSVRARYRPDADQDASRVQSLNDDVDKPTMDLPSATRSLDELPGLTAKRYLSGRRSVTPTHTYTPEPVTSAVVKGPLFVGMAVEIMSPSFKMEDYFEEQGEHFLMDLGPAGGISFVTRTPSDMHEVLDTKAHDFYISWPSSVSKLAFPFGKPYSNEDSTKWRNAVQRAVSPSAVAKLHVPLMVEEFHSRIHKHAQSGAEILWRKESKRMAVPVATRAILGDLVTEEDIDYLFPRVCVNGDSMFELDFGLKDGLPFTNYRKGITARYEIIAYLSKKILKVLDASEDRGGDCIMGRLLEGLKSEGVISDSTPHESIAERLAQEIHFLIFAGNDTTASFMSRIVLALAKHPQWLDALWKEQQKLMVEYGDVIDRRVLSRSPVALAFLQETMRLEPPVRYTYRTALHDTSVGDFKVPKGTTILLATTASLRATGSGTSTFDPDYWLSEDRTEVTLNKDPGNFTFGVGPRNCVGQNLATTELLILMAVLGREVKKVDMSEEEQNLIWFTGHPTGMPLRFIARQQ